MLVHSNAPGTKSTSASTAGRITLTFISVDSCEFLVYISDLVGTASHTHLYIWHKVANLLI